MALSHRRCAICSLSDPAIHPLNLTEDEQHALLAFLESLSGSVLEGGIR